MPQRVRNSQTFSPLKAQAAGRDEAFPVEYRGDFLVHFAGAVELGDPLPQPFNVDVVAVGVNAPLQAMLAGRAGLPDDLEPYLTSQSLRDRGRLRA